MNTNNPEWIATEEWIVRAPNGESKRTQFKIGKPYFEQYWACPVDIGEPIGRNADIGGDTSIQSLALALCFAKKVLNSLAEKGYQWFDPESHEELPVDILINLNFTKNQPSVSPNPPTSGPVE